MKNLIIILLLSSPALLSQNPWELIHTFNEDIISIEFIDTELGFVSSNSKIYKTIDGGSSWVDVNISDLNTSISKMIFLSNNSLLGVGGNGTIIKSTDGGNNWSVNNIGDTENLASICYSNDGKVFVCSVGNKIYKSIDNGENWVIIETPAYILWDIAFLNSDTGYAVGLYNTSIKTTDGGETWFSIDPIIQGRSMFAITFVNKDIGYVVGGSEIAKTSDGGNSWQIKQSLGGPQLNDITTYGENIAWVVGSNLILKTNNTGETWTQQTFSPYHYLLAAECLDSLVCFTIGGEGSLYKTSNGGWGVTAIKEETINLSAFSLYQNYPNPFNPATTISYSIPQVQNVELRIYDLLGNEIKNLVNEYKLAGKHTIEFDGSTLSSGIYIYQLKTDNFIQSKKLILIK